ncbi:DUF262 domain-containing protein [Acidovorax kalamii]|uniref:DUF262 domain-containing protein n=1 Tax=Acidovorax kalamii TaxID=2004485 RepID=UPI0020909C6B
MIKYQIRSRELLDLIKDVRDKRLVISPYFQRDLVWRELHKVDFIKTIRMGYPFPQIFISRGRINVDTMTSQACVVDGQQRMNAIQEYLADELKVDGGLFSQLPPSEKEQFLKYEVPVIDLDLAEDDPQIIDVFKRLNRTFYSLSKIEKLSTEYAPSEFMFVAKLLTDQLSLATESEDPLKKDPNVPEELYEWAASQKVSSYQLWLLNSGIFSPYESSRKAPLMFTLNLMATSIGGFFNRNDLAESYLESYKEGFTKKSTLIKNFEKVAKFLLDLELPQGSYWFNKANAFSIFAFLVSNSGKLSAINKAHLKDRLTAFEQRVPPKYALAAKEAVNNVRERSTRDEYISKLVYPNTKKPTE